jgi:hypothetical protein
VQGVRESVWMCPPLTLSESGMESSDLDPLPQLLRVCS